MDTRVRCSKRGCDISAVTPEQTFPSGWIAASVRVGEVTRYLIYCQPSHAVNGFMNVVLEMSQNQTQRR